MDPIAITTATLAVVAHCAKGLGTIHKYCSAAQQAELNIRLLADECTTIQTAVANCRILSRTPNGLPSSLADYEDVRIALKNCERIFDDIAEATGSPSSSPPKKAVTSTLAERVSSPSEGNSRPALLSAAPSKTVQLTSVVGRRQLSFYPYESPGNKHHRILRVVEESVDEMGQSNAIPLERLVRPRSRCSRPSLCTVRQAPAPDELRHPGRLLRR